MTYGQETVVIPAHAGQRDPAPSRPHVIISIGNQRHKIEINTKNTLLPNRAADPTSLATLANRAEPDANPNSSPG